MNSSQKPKLSGREYEAGFETKVDSITFEKGLNEEVVRRISSQKKEPRFLLDFRLKALKFWEKMANPNWAEVNYPPINHQDIRYFSAPKSQTEGPKSLEEVDEEVLRTFERLGIPLSEQKALRCSRRCCFR